jgi:hypothetical protein
MSPRRIPLAELSCTTRDVTFVSVRRSQHRDPEELVDEPEELRNAWAANVVDPHEVIFAPIEVQPFAVRFQFRDLEDESGSRKLHLVGTPHLVERSSPPSVLAPITPEHQQTLDENRERYRRMAENYLEVDLAAASAERTTMLEASRLERPPSRAYYVDLANEYLALLAARGRRDVINTLAGRYLVSERQIQRDLDRCEEFGSLPAGTRPRRRTQH